MDWIVALVDREVARGVPTERIVLAGFSQGAAMALFTGLRLDRPLAGLLVLSGYLVLEDTLDAERATANAATPVFFGHGVEGDARVAELAKHGLLDGGRHDLSVGAVAVEDAG